MDFGGYPILTIKRFLQGFFTLTPKGLMSSWEHLGLDLVPRFQIQEKYSKILYRMGNFLSAFVDMIFVEFGLMVQEL